MTAYLDSSVVLRLVLRQQGALDRWGSIVTAVVSGLVQVECLRTVDRLRLQGLGDAEIAAYRQAVFRLLQDTEVVEPTRPVLARAAAPMPVALGTLDAVHLATALLWRERTGTDLVMATHDEALALAARASGLEVIGA